MSKRKKKVIIVRCPECGKLVRPIEVFTVKRKKTQEM